jgi:hypothetical protein
MVEDEIDFDARELCSDGSCTGLIGSDGRCRICGRSKIGEAVEGSATELEASEPDENFADRELCPDGNCTGILGPDRRCKLCGTSS